MDNSVEVKKWLFYDRLVHRMKHRGFLSSEDADAAQLVTKVDSKLFKAICNNPQHVVGY